MTQDTKERAKALLDRLRDNPPADPVPDGFTVRKLSTTTNAAGEVQAQSITAAPESHIEVLESARPDGHTVRGVSTLLGPDGSVRAQWVKTRAEDVRQQAWVDALPALLEPLRGAVGPTPAPRVDSDHLTGYVIGDAHIGMLSWAPETGAHWDLHIAETMLMRAADALLAATPATRECLVVDVGDYQHADTPEALTPHGKNPLDVEGRDQKVRRVALRVKRYYIDRALLKHERVHVINQPGNHDPYATSWLSLALEALYEREPRVVIDTSPAPHRVHRHGRTLIGVTHKPKKAEDLGHLMAATWPDEWGASRYRYWLTGHVHHESRKERPGFKVETFGILPPGDRWHVEQGYLATRQIVAITWSPKYGESGRYTITAEELAE